MWNRLFGNDKDKKDQPRSSSQPSDNQPQEQQRQPLQTKVPTERTYAPEDLKSEEAKKYDWTQVTTFTFEPKQLRMPFNVVIQNLDDPDSLPDDMWELDDRLIDTDMLQLENEEANRVYKDLKSRALRRQQQEKKRKKMDDILNEDDEDITDDDHFGIQTGGSRESISGGDDFKKNQINKILGILNKSNTQEKLDFSNNLLNFIETSIERRNCEALMPGLTLLSKDQPEVKKSLLNQLKPLTQLFSEKFGLDGYTTITKTVFPILSNLMYDNDEQVRDKAIIVVGEMRKVVQDAEKESIMKLTLDLAHEEGNEKLRETAVKLINEIAPEMGQEVCEFFIVHEICSLGLDPKANVRQAVARNLVSISKCVSLDCFTKKLFPLYKDILTQDKEEKVRKTCADVVAEFTQVSPIDKTATELQNLYFGFLQDQYSKIVRGTAFQNIGPFIACFKDHSPIDPRIINFFINTTEKTTSKDVTFYASINFPAFIYVTGEAEWPKYRKLYLKLAQSQDAMTKKTIACSVHELARILGQRITQADLVDVVDRFLKDGHADVRNAILKNLHIFLENVDVERRNKYITQIVSAFNEAGKRDWRTKEIFARNLHKLVELYPMDVVQQEFVQMFFKFCDERIATVSEAAATAFAAIINKFATEPAKQLQLITKVKREFREGTYKKRQLFLIMAASVMNRKDMKQIFIEHFKEDTLSLAYDKVPNVRIALARVLKSHFRINNGCFIDDKQMTQVVTNLHDDEEEDVRNIIAQIKDIHASAEDSSSDVVSNTSSTHVTPMDEPQEEKEPDFAESLQNKYEGDHSDLALSSQSATSISEAEAAQVESEVKDLIEEAKEENVNVEDLLKEQEEEQFAHLEVEKEKEQKSQVDFNKMSETDYVPKPDDLEDNETKPTEVENEAEFIEKESETKPVAEEESLKPTEEEANTPVQE